MPHKTSMVLLAYGLVLASCELPEFPNTVRDMEVQTGYYTADGKYLGGIPKTEAVSREIYECLDFYVANDTENTTACMEWRADESAGGTFQIGSCACRFVTDENYCSAWVCNQVKKTTDCYSNGGCYTSTNTDSVLCQCDVETSSGLFCDKWSCKQIDSEGRVEYEEYTCLRTSPSGQYCEAWNGNVTASDEVEVVACQCVAEWNGDLMCSYWECEEVGLKSCSSAGLSWCDVYVSVAVGGGFGFAGVVAICCSMFAIIKKKNSGDVAVGAWLSIFFGILWCCVWSIGVVIWGGIDGATYVGILWGTPLLLASIVACCVLNKQAEKGSAPTPHVIAHIVHPGTERG